MGGVGRQVAGKNIEPTMLQAHSCLTSVLVELAVTPTLCLPSALTAVFCRRVDGANSVMETS